MPSITMSFAPGICAAVSRPAATGTSGSAAPWITSVGALILGSSQRRSPEEQKRAAEDHQGIGEEIGEVSDEEDHEPFG